MFIDALIGGIGGAVSRTAVAPIELFRIQRQNHFIPNSTLRDVCKKESFRYLWKGNGTNCIRIFPQLAVNYAVFRKTKDINDICFKNKNVSNFVSGVQAGIASMLVTYPLETTRTYLSLQTNKNKFSSITNVIKNVKPLQLYQGLGMSLFGFGLWSGLQYSSYYYINKQIKNTMFDSKLLSGGLSGLFAISITYPTDLIRRRLQLQGFDNSVPKYNGIFDAIRKIYKPEGKRGFYRGLYAHWLKTAPTVAIQFWVIEHLNHLRNTEEEN